MFDQTPVTVSVNGISAAVNGQSFAAAGVPLAVGENTITVSATDLGGNTTTASVRITRQLPRPKAYLDSDADKIPARITETITLNGRATTLLHDILQAKKEARR